jgi:hypothetical protein
VSGVLGDSKELRPLCVPSLGPVLKAPAPVWFTSCPDQKPVRVAARDPSQSCRSVIPIQTGADLRPRFWKETEAAMPMLAEVADAVIGVDTHRDTHALQIAHPQRRAYRRAHHQ